MLTAEPPRCGSLVPLNATNSTASIQSPGFSSGSYPPTTSCQWVIGRESMGVLQPPVGIHRGGWTNLLLGMVIL